MMVVQYVLHRDVPAYEAMGWTRSPALEGTNHGFYSVLMIAPMGDDDENRLCGYEQPSPV